MYTILICNSLFLKKRGVPQAANTQKAVSDHLSQNKRNILIYRLLKYLYNNYTLSRLFLCSVPSNKAFNLESHE